jgi:hypothetical protein
VRFTQSIVVQAKYERSATRRRAFARTGTTTEERAMDRKPVLPPRPHFVSFVAAMLAVLIAVGVLSSIGTVFASDRAPLERVAHAGRA